MGLIGGLVAFVMLVCYGNYRHGQWLQNEAPMEFVRHWATQFRRCRTPEAIQALPNSDALFRRFPNGEWVAIRHEYSCCSGAGFNATVFYDSRGRVHYDTWTRHCGTEGLGAHMRAVNATDLDGFFAGLITGGAPLKKMP